MMAEVLVTFAVLAAGTALTYLIQYNSVISPDYVEFDGGSKKELARMKTYNNIMDKGFRLYTSLVGIAVLVSFISGDIVYLVVGLYIQLVYFVAALAVMLFMYGRSRLYQKHINKCAENPGDSREGVEKSG